MEALLGNIIEILTSIWQFILNIIDASNIAFVFIRSSVPFLFSLVGLVPGIIGSAIVIVVTVAVIKLMAQVFGGGA